MTSDFRRASYPRPGALAAGLLLALFPLPPLAEAARPPKVAVEVEDAPPADREAAWRRIELAEDRRWTDEGFEQLLHHPDPAVRGRVVRALGRIGDPAWFDALAGALDDDVEAVRAEAAFALAQVPSFDATDRERASLQLKAEERLLLALGAPKRRSKARPMEVDRQAAWRALGEVGSEGAVEALWAESAEGRPEGRVAALLALGTLARRKVLPPLGAEQLARLGPALFDQGQGAARAAAMVLARAGVVPDQQAAALDRLEQARAVVRDPLAIPWLLRAIGKVADPRGVAILHAIAADPQAPLPARIGAIRGAGAAGTATALLALLADGDSLVAEEVALVLSAKPSDEGGAALLSWTPRTPDLQAVRLRALGPHAGAEGADQALLAAILAELGSPDPGIRAAAADAVAGHPAGTAALLDRLPQERHATARASLLSALGTGTALESEAALLGALDDPDPVYAGTGAEALSRREGAHLRAALLSALATTTFPEGAERGLAFAEALAARTDLDETSARALIDHPDRRVRTIGRRALARLAGRSSLGPAEPWTGDDAPAVPPRQRGSVRVEVHTSKGSIRLLLDGEEAPIAVGNFLQLAANDVFDTRSFHRVVADFVVQTGDPRDDGSGGPGYRIPCEYNPRPYTRGAVGMALSGKDTGGSQWFITLAPHPHLDGHYTWFGQVEAGFDVLDSLRRGDTILDVRRVEDR